MGVNYDIPCYNVSTTDNTTTELEEVVVLGANSIDTLLNERAGKFSHFVRNTKLTTNFSIDDQSDWYHWLTSGLSDTSCSNFPSTGENDGCSVLQEEYCFAGNITDGQFWASFLTSNLYANWVQWYNAFEYATFMSSLDISKIATIFTPSKTESILTAEQFLNGFSTGLSIGAKVLPDSGGEAFSELGSGVDTLQSILSYLTDGSGFALPTTGDIELIMDSALGNLTNATYDAIFDLATATFQYPNETQTCESNSLYCGPFNYPVSNYIYNVKPVTIIDTKHFQELQNSLASTIKKILVGVALASGDYYVMKSTYVTEADCGAEAEYYINGACYLLAYPGESSCQLDNGFQRLANSTTIKNIEGYGVNITEMFLNAEACQNQTQMYYGTAGVNVTEVATSGSLPSCFYNLPVFEVTVLGSEGPSPYSTPCWIAFRNGTKETPIVGETYLPPNLAPAFAKQPCTCLTCNPCGGQGGGATNGTLDGSLMVC